MGNVILYTPSIDVWMAQEISATLSADAASMPASSGWTDVLEVAIPTRGGTDLRVGATVVASGTGIAYQSQARVTFGGSVVGPDTADVPQGGAGCASIRIPLQIPQTASVETYAIKLQVRASVALTSAVPLKGCALTVAEYARRS